MGKGKEEVKRSDSLTRYQMSVLEESGLSVKKLHQAQDLIKYLTSRDEGLISMIVHDVNWHQLLNKQRWGELAADTSVRLFAALIIAKQTKVKETKASLDECIRRLKGYGGEINQTTGAERRASSSVPPPLQGEAQI